jgi:hypothetical protein
MSRAKTQPTRSRGQRARKFNRRRAPEHFSQELLQLGEMTAFPLSVTGWGSPRYASMPPATHGATGAAGWWSVLASTVQGNFKYPLEVEVIIRNSVGD